MKPIYKKTNKPRISDYDPFDSDNQKLQLGQQSNLYGTRNGKMFQTDKWKRTSEGFALPNKTEEECLPSAKLQQLKKRFNIPEISQSQGNAQSDDQQKGSNNKSNNQQQSRPIKIYNPPNSIRKRPHPPNRLSLGQEFQLSFEECEISQSTIMSNKKQFQSQSIKKVAIRSPQKKQLRQTPLVNYQQIKIPINSLKSKSKSKKKSSKQKDNKKSQQKRDKQPHNRKQENNNQFLQNQRQSKQKEQNIKKSPPKSRLLKELQPRKSKQNTKKPMINRLISPSKRDTYQEQQTSWQEHLRNSAPTEQHAAILDRALSKISTIKRRRRRPDRYVDQQSLNLTVQDIMNNLQQNKSDGQTNQLNKAIINTESQNNLKNQDKDKQYQKKNNGFKKNKNSQDLNEQNRTSQIAQKLSKNSLNIQLRKRKSGNNFLSDSITKQAEDYHQNQEKIIKNTKQLNKNKSKQIPKVVKRLRQFQEISTEDILNTDVLQRMQRIKQLDDNAEATKKFKTNQNKKDIKFKEKQKQNSGIIFQRNDDSYFEDSGYDSNEQIKKKKKEQQQKIKKNNKNVQQADKKLKRKQRPQRVSPPKIKTKIKQPKVKRKPKSQQNSNQVQIDRVPQQDHQSNNDQSHIQKKQQKRYPKRNRLPPMKWYQGEKPVYNNKRQLIGVQTKQVHVLIHYTPQNQHTKLKVNQICAKQTFLLEKIEIQPKKTLDFNGFDGAQFKQLQITYQKGKPNSSYYGKQVQIYYENDICLLKKVVYITPDPNSHSGIFSITNTGNQTAYVELKLQKNYDMSLS